VIADVTDATADANDRVEVFIDENNGKTRSYERDDARYLIQRDQKHNGSFEARVKQTETGYRVEAAIPLKSAATAGQQIGFDLRVTDASNPDAPLSWNDRTHSQNSDTSKFGTLTLTPAVKLAQAVQGAPVIDGVIESAWSKAPEIVTNTWVQGASGSTARVKAMWDAGHLYILAVVTDSKLSKASANPWEQDSVELFVDQNNAKSATYQSDDGQYRVNYANEQSYGGAASAENFVTATKITSGGYVVEAAIALDAVQAQKGMYIGFDVQVNNDELGDGTRSSVATWNDPSGQSYQNTSKLGVLLLTRK
jgi:endo-1,4-beta-xylanase